MRLAAALLFGSLLGTAAADTVVLRSGEKVGGKVIPYGEFVIVASGPGKVRILDPILIDLTIESPSALACFLDLPPPGEDAPDPDPSRVHVYGSAKAKARGLLELGTRRGVPVDTAARAREALQAMGAEAEDELLSAIRPDGDKEKVALALACLEKSQPKGLEKRLVETALRSDQESLCRMAAEALKRRTGRTPPEVLRCLLDPKTSWPRTRAAAEVAGVIGDRDGIAALVKAVETRGALVITGPHVPYVNGFTQIQDGALKSGGLVARNKKGGLSLVRISWMDEDVQLKEPNTRVLYHLLGALRAATGKEFENLQELQDWWAAGGKP